MKALSLLALASFAIAPLDAALADSCRRADDRLVANERARPDCRPDERLRPYEPDRVRAGRDPGFVDLGNGTEVRVGGRVRMDYDARR